MSISQISNSPIQIRQVTSENGTPRLILSGICTLSALEQQLHSLSADLAAFAADPNLHWDLTEIKQIDDAGALLLWQAWGSRRPKHLGLRPEQEKLFDSLGNIPAAPEPVPRDLLGPVRAMGNAGFLVWEHITSIIILTGQLLLDVKYLITHPARIPWREISATLFRTGAQALGITAIVGFLIGVVLSYLSSKQLQTYGADIFIINILGVSIIRELGPMLAAILVAGRSGSSMTAQLGVMRVTEELDALAVMGIPHSMRLVLPKIIGLGIAMPLIVLWTSAIALKSDHCDEWRRTM